MLSTQLETILGKAKIQLEIILDLIIKELGGIYIKSNSGQNAYIQLDGYQNQEVNLEANRVVHQNQIMRLKEERQEEEDNLAFKNNLKIN